jgi:hypothetical protein
MPPIAALAPCLGIALLLAAVAAVEPLRLAGRAAVVGALLPAGLAALLVAYVAAEDTYRRGGISRWQAYRSPGGALGPLLVVTVALLAACAVGLAVFALRRRQRPYRATALVAMLVAVLLALPVIVGFSAN